MKKAAFGLVGMALFCWGALSARQIQTGTYELLGCNDATGVVHYRGEVVICPQGENYGLLWKIGRSQTQIGVGILEGDVLSVAYSDTSNGSFGVVSFKIISNSELDGKWSPMKGSSYGREHLTFKNSSLY